MTSLELSTNLYNASVAEFGVDATENSNQFPSLYFDHTVEIINPTDGSMEPRNPDLCATLLGAQSLQQVFTADNPEAQGYVAGDIVMGNAMDFGGLEDGWKDSKDVPYLTFSNASGQVTNAEGVVGATDPINCGLLLQCFNHFDESNQSIGKAIGEIEGI